MKIGVVNTGSSSIKCSLYDSDHLTLLWEDKKEMVDNIDKTLALMWNNTEAVEAIGHRVVHGGDQFIKPTLITPTVKKDIYRLAELAPLHNPLNLKGIEAMEKLYPDVPQIAVFDTAFQHTMPDAQRTYPIPESWRTLGIRRFGFHGISHRYCSQQAAALLHNPSLKMINCHLGNGSSLAAIDCGKSIDTTMGFTPLEGLMMGSRSGSIDPGILFFLLDKHYSYNELDHSLNFESGLKGITGTEDMRQVLDHLDRPINSLGYRMFILSVKKHILAMMASLNPIDLIVFTAGIGENSPKVRADACSGLSFLGVDIDSNANDKGQGDRIISTNHSSIKVMVIHTKENKAIAEDVFLTI